MGKLMYNVRARVHYTCGMVGRDHPLHRKARRLFTDAQIAERLGCSVATVRRLRRSFLTRRQLDYLNLLGYVPGFFPRRREEG